MSTQQDLNKQDDITVSSDVVIDEPQTRGSKYNTKTFVIVGLIALAIILGVSFGVSRNDDVVDESPILAQEPTTFDFELVESYPSASATDLCNRGDGAWDIFGYVDASTGCINVFHHEDSTPTEALCNNYVGNVESLFLHSSDLAIAHNGAVEVWRSTLEGDHLVWSELPEGSNTISVADATGFGKKMYKTGRNLFIQADNAVYHFFLENEVDLWYEMNFWNGATGFDVDAAEQYVTIYDENQVSLYSLDSDFWWSSAPTISTYRRPVVAASVGVDGELHVVTSQTGYLIVESSTRAKSFANYKMIGNDILYSLSSGCIYDVRAGAYLGVEIEGGDILDIEVTKDRVAVLINRDGTNVVEVYERA